MSPADERHVVFGSGPVGLAVVDALLAQGKRVRVVSRSGARRALPVAVEVVRGDATDPEDTRRVCAGATHVYNCTNAPDYHRWPEQFPPLQRGVLAGAAAAGAKLIVMENLYGYGPHGGAPMTEATPLRGHGSRSTTRRRMTEELFAAHRAGRVRAVSVRASDLLGPHVTESLVGERFFGPFLAGKRVRLFADPDVPHSLSVVGDVGRAMVTVGAHDAALGRAWHAPNAPAVSLRAFAALVGEETGLAPPIVVPAAGGGPGAAAGHRPGRPAAARAGGEPLRLLRALRRGPPRASRRPSATAPPRSARRSARPSPGHGATGDRADRGRSGGTARRARS